MRLFSAFVLTLITATKVLACSCITTGNAFEAARTQPVVFRGTVVASELLFIDKDGSVFASAESPRDRQGTLARVAVLRVLERFKGELAPFVVMATGSGGGDCGFTFETGKTYVVYATWTKESQLTKFSGTPRALTTSICSFTTDEASATDLLPKLRRTYGSTAPMTVQ